ncbi:receptor-like protein kinase FERONIA [Neltuma alba]|uniref:receptor-like protein kinase FERONIA n=1 Tax=Neltuma alba TaxID=207710 RepID=UPI0010A54538|nr:receptor-like protein kinase FERONIA [Prosopis alba]
MPGQDKIYLETRQDTRQGRPVLGQLGCPTLPVKGSRQLSEILFRGAPSNAKAYHRSSGACWRWDEFASGLPQHVLEQIAGIHSPTQNTNPGKCIWSLTSSLRFTTRSAYRLIMEDDWDDESDRWKLVWKWLRPHRVRTFLWLAMSNKLLTNEINKVSDERERQTAVSRVTNPPTIVVAFQLFFFFQLLSTIASYNPDDHFSVNCGGSDSFSSSYGQNWTGDTNSGLFSPIELFNSNNSSVGDNADGKSIPYKTARFSRSEFSYSFPVKTGGQKFVRLYFYPSSYNLNFLRFDAFFSVKAGPHTLLKDFNASLNADAGASLEVAAPDGAIVREYCVNVDPGQRLNIAFTPNGSHPNAYAFVNGIEVVSMPDFLYYTDPENLQGMMLDGGTQQYPVQNSSALETVYRANVGGGPIGSSSDTGMFRYWEQDNPYLERERPQSVSAGFGLDVDHTNYPNYTAPDVVYKTARNYGRQEKSKFNVTWRFQVDSVFHYMVRLHFCEFDENIEKVGDRVFQIFINDALVEPLADVMIWAHKRLVPIHKDYAVSMPSDGRSKKLNLSIQLQPHPTARSTYRDVLLNGIEIFKISDYNDNLAGPNPDPIQSPSTPSYNSSRNRNKGRVIFIIVVATSGFLVLSLIVLFIFRRFIRAPVKEGSSWWGQKSVDSSKKDKPRGSSSLPSDLCRYFSIDEIRAATSNFNDIFIVGVGGFGNVYKGYIDDGTVPVAIKRLKPGSQQGLREFQTEIEMLSQLRHNHLVPLIGYCNDGNEMILVYEFMARGTLRDHIYDSDNPPLSWKQRLAMCIGAARGLHYLHTGANRNIIHRDVKSTNILIDEKWVAKVSDFGLSKIGPTGLSKSHISTVVKGSMGYLDPEYYKRQRLTEKSDVYSFGVVLLEVLCGRPPLIRNVEKQKLSLVEWVRKCHHEGVIHQTVDPFLVESITPECLKAFSDMALKCLGEDGNERPSMNDVVWGLEFALQLQEGTEEAGLLVDEGEIEGKSEERALIRKTTNVEERESKVGFTSSDESKGSRLTSSSSEDQSLVSGLIFSELGHPSVR